MAALVLAAKPDTDGEAPLLTALLAGIYAGVVLVLGQLFGGLSAEPPTWAVAAPPWLSRRCSSRPAAVEPTQVPLWRRPSASGVSGTSRSEARPTTWAY